MIGGEFIKVADPKSVVKMRNSQSGSLRLSNTSLNEATAATATVPKQKKGSSFCCCCYDSEAVADSKEPLLTAKSNSSSSGLKRKKKLNQQANAPSVLDKFVGQNDDDDNNSNRKISGTSRSETSQKKGSSVFRWNPFRSSKVDGNESEEEVDDEKESRYSSYRTSADSYKNFDYDDSQHENSSHYGEDTSSNLTTTALQNVMANHERKVNAALPHLEPKGNNYSTKEEPGTFSSIA